MNGEMLVGRLNFGGSFKLIAEKRNRDMKQIRGYVQNIFFCLIFFVILCQANKFRVPETFGKTHFISGFFDYSSLTPTQKFKQKKVQNTKCKVLFSPTQVVCDQLCHLIVSEQSKICVAVYTLTDTQIAKALIEAQKRGVIIEIITDRSSPLDRATKIGMLQQAGIPIFLYQPRLENNVQKGLMHNKFALFFNNKDGREIIWHGSFNFTRSGYRYNCESILLLEDAQLFSQFLSEFEHIKQKSIRYTP
jgi:phosphatidylserine/phosphatidylglycerophosphate/cardiolipin synthase-like enzyme